MAEHTQWYWCRQGIDWMPTTAPDNWYWDEVGPPMYPPGQEPGMVGFSTAIERFCAKVRGDGTTAELARK